MVMTPAERCVLATAARAEKISPEKRKEIASNAILKRWHGEKPRATHNGSLPIGGIQIACSVLQDGTRVLSETGITESFGSRSGASRKNKKNVIEKGGSPLPIFMGYEALKPLISNDLMDGLLNPIEYISGTQICKGYKAQVLPQVCEVWLKARETGLLKTQQYNKAARAEILMRALAHVGINALVDESTGYQEIRDKNALQAILDKYLRSELAAWAKRFPDEFYKQIFRLRGWTWKGMSVKRPQCIAMYTNNVIYDRLTPGILEELQSRNPSENGVRKTRHHQWLTTDVGHPALSQHMHLVIGLMKLSPTWESFIEKIDLLCPSKSLIDVEL